MAELILGRSTDYPQRYAPEVLYPVGRAEQRSQLGIVDTLPFRGADLWRAYELSWCNERGKPQCAQALFIVPCNSSSLIESKSFKLYLNSLNQSRFETAEALRLILQQDLSAAAGDSIDIRLLPAASGTSLTLPWPDLQSLDNIETDCEDCSPDASLLTCSGPAIEEALFSDLFRSLCPVTGQPDWGSVYLRYAGQRIDHAALLRYVVSFREHQGFHEDCVERMFCDILRQCQPEWLVLGIQFLRRGGLEINPWRWSATAPVSAADQLLFRSPRQ